MVWWCMARDVILIEPFPAGLGINLPEIKIDKMVNTIMTFELKTAECQKIL